MEARDPTMSGQNGPFAYVTTQFLQMINNRLWRLMLLGFEKIVLPHSDPSLLTNPTDGQMAFIKSIVHMLYPEEFPESVQTEGPDERPCQGSVATYMAGRNGSIEEIRQLASMEEITGGHVIPHSELSDYLEKQLPPFSVNNFVWETTTSLRDVLLAAYLHRTGMGTAFIHRYDWSVLHELWQVALPLKTDENGGAVGLQHGLRRYTRTRELRYEPH